MQARGYERHDWVEGRLVTSEDPPRRARLLQAYIKPSSTFDRWRFGLRGPIQARPWIVLELVGRGRAERDERRGVTPPLTIVNPSAHMASQTTGKDELWAAELQNLKEALSGKVRPGAP
jgi:hypothetical protein